MSLENIQRAGGVIPKTSGPPGAAPPNRTTERVEEAMTRGLEMKALARASGLDSHEERPPSAPAAKQEERTSLDVAALFKAQTDQSNLLLNKITDLTAANSGIAATQEVRDIKATIGDIQKRLENPNTANPIETFAANLDSFLSIGEKLASLRGPAEAPPAPNPQAGDIELKKLDLLLQESRRHAMDGAHALRVLCRQRRDRGHAKAAQRRHGFQIRLDTGPAAAVGTRNRQHPCIARQGDGRRRIQ